MKSKFFTNFWKVIIYVVFGIILGSLSSRFTTMENNNISTFLSNVETSFIQNSENIFIGVLVTSVLLSLLFSYLGKRQMMESVEKEADLINENLITVAVIIPNIGVYLLLVSTAGVFLKTLMAEEFSVVKFTILIVSLMLYSLFMVIIQKKSIEDIKLVYPEKSGNAFDFKFQSTWEEGLDEREKILLYHSGYSTYQFLDKVLLFLLALTIISALSFNTGIYPTLIVGIIQVLSNIAYLHYSLKYQNK